MPELWPLHLNPSHIINIWRNMVPSDAPLVPRSCILSGYRHALQCLPRLLTLFCDYGTDQLLRSGSGKGVPQKERQAGTAVGCYHE